MYIWWSHAHAFTCLWEEGAIDLFDFHRWTVALCSVVELVLDPISRWNRFEKWLMTLYKVQLLLFCILCTLNMKVHLLICSGYDTFSGRYYFRRTTQIFWTNCLIICSAERFLFFFYRVRCLQRNSLFVACFICCPHLFFSLLYYEKCQKLSTSLFSN